MTFGSTLPIRCGKTILPIKRAVPTQTQFDTLWPLYGGYVTLFRGPWLAAHYLARFLENRSPYIFFVDYPSFGLTYDLQAPSPLQHYVGRAGGKTPGKSYFKHSKSLLDITQVLTFTLLAENDLGVLLRIGVGKPFSDDSSCDPFELFVPRCDH